MVNASLCEGFADLNGSGGGYDVYHRVYTFADGSVVAHCEVASGVTSTTNMYVYRPISSGAPSGFCELVRDADTTTSQGFWEFALNSTKTQGTAVYHDRGSPFDGRTATLTCVTY